MPEIEAAYESLVQQHRHRENKAPCGKVQVLKVMKEHPQKIWWWSYDFIGCWTSDDEYLSHRAPARASDLANFHPHLVEDRKIGRFSVYRLRTENMEAVEKFIQCNK